MAGGHFQAMVFFDFFDGLNIFNGELSGLGGGAFRLRAVGSDKDGNPKRAKEFVLFTNGFFSLVMQGHQIESDLPQTVGYCFEFIKKTNGQGVTYWEVRSSTEDLEVSRHELRQRTNGTKILKASTEKPTGEEVTILSAVEGNPGQYIYLAP